MSPVHPEAMYTAVNEDDRHYNTWAYMWLRCGTLSHIYKGEIHHYAYKGNEQPVQKMNYVNTSGDLYK